MSSSAGSNVIRIKREEPIDLSGDTEMDTAERVIKQETRDSSNSGMRVSDGSGFVVSTAAGGNMAAARATPSPPPTASPRLTTADGSAAGTVINSTTVRSRLKRRPKSILDYLCSLDRSVLNVLYRDTFTCLTIFRSLHPLAKQYLLRWLFVTERKCTLQTAIVLQEQLCRS